MASTLRPSLDMGPDDQLDRAQKLAAARRKLKSFRARQSDSDSMHDASVSMAASTSSSSSSSLPLSTDVSFNAAARIQQDGPPFTFKLEDGRPRSPSKLCKPKSRGSLGGHRRQASSASGQQPTYMTLFDPGQPLRAESPRVSQCHVLPVPELPLDVGVDADAEHPAQDPAVAKARLSSFSFGSKAPNNRRSPSMTRFGQPLLPSQILSRDRDASSPNSSPTKRMSTPLSRPPSLLLTRATPLQFDTPSSAGPSTRPIEPPTTPPTPARSKRHSHTRSNSISLPNLKLSSRPPSLVAGSSPSFPSSPSSPSLPGRGATIPLAGTRLKFEPSGRGAEAEKEQEEYRRRALEKLTGTGGSPVLPESPRHEISLPDLEDDDSSVASSARPRSSLGSWSFGRPTSSSSTPTRFSWSMNDDSPPPERWSTGSKADEDSALGFGGFSFQHSSSGSFTLSNAPAIPLETTPAGIGMGLPTIVPRPGLTRNLSVLAEVDEPEDGVDTETVHEQTLVSSPTRTSFCASDATEVDEENAAYVPIIAPTPSRLRELHLVSANGTPGSARSTTTTTTASQQTPSSAGSPTKGYGTIGRGRPALGSIINVDSPTASSSGLASTPNSASRRRNLGSGSRGSSISYKRDGESTSSREWSFSSSSNSKVPFSPTELVSPPVESRESRESRFAGWNSVPRGNISRPCPRPKSLAGLGPEGKGAGRILGEVEEVDEDVSAVSTGFRLSLGSKDSASSGRGSSEQSRDSFNGYAWRDPQLELEMERDALREDVDLWRGRCSGLESSLETEKKENGVLRERVRKLGDRLSSVASYPAINNRDTSLISDLRTQLFTASAKLDRERQAHISAKERIAELEAQLHATRMPCTQVTPPTPISPESTDESPDLDLDGSRMRSWGFPQGPVGPGPGKPRNRDSFFGLSQPLKQRQSTIEEDTLGFDLPPIAPGLGSVHAEDERLGSVTALSSFISGYLPKVASPPRASPTKASPTNASPTKSVRLPQSEQRLPSCHHKGDLDFRRACQCCHGRVIEL